MNRLLIIANRLPVNVTKSAAGLHLNPSCGGLATALSSLNKDLRRIWVGWPGIAEEHLSPDEKIEVTEKLQNKNCLPVFLSQKDIDNYYHGFSNKTLWPLFHYFPSYTAYEEKYWHCYSHVNQLFCEAVLEIAQPDDYIWVHDYHLLLLPQLVREKIPDANIGFFLHIPFPSFELFRLLPWRTEILHGMLGADIVGFHTYDYVRHFLRSLSRISAIDQTMNTLRVGNRLIKVDAFPMGIDYEKYSRAIDNPQTQQEIAAIRNTVGKRKIIISIDRLDYSKGVLQRLEAFDLFLTQNPQYKKNVTLILLAVPSRASVDDYAALRNRLEGLVGRINGRHGSLGWVPVWYLYRAVPFERLIALYNVADVALVTPLRDGMNLIAKEFIATRNTGSGVLILSEMAGAASELGEAVIVNANNKIDVAQAIKTALEMSQEEQLERNRAMQKRLSRYNLFKWENEFIEALTIIKKAQQDLAIRLLSKSSHDRLIKDYQNATKRLLLLDYDGTLVRYAVKPQKAGPDKELLNLLNTIGKDPKNELVIVSGRDRVTLTHWLDKIESALIAEHGAWIKEKNGDWKVIEPLTNTWKDLVKPIMQLYVDRTPGSAIEEKDFSLVWHFRAADPELAYLRIQELRDALLSLTANMDIGVFEGNKILEVKNIGISKAAAAKLWLAKQDWDFILSAGDDYTDEDLFSVMPQQAYSIKLGHSISKAKFNLASVDDMRTLLKQLVQINE